jgi:hypothetical protein
MKIGRELNKVVHELAQLAIMSGRSIVSFSFIPDCVQDLVLKERMHDPDAVTLPT